MKTYFVLISMLFFFLMSHSSYAQSNTLEEGDKAPNFSATADNGKNWSSKGIMDKKNLVVYFYPAAMTGGCTKQACAYRDNYDELSSLDAEVVGISGDEVDNLKLFKQVHDLNFTLLSDPDGSIAKKFGVPIREGEKSIEREVEGVMHTLSRPVTTSRWTFVIDKNGKVVYKSSEVNAAEDSDNVIAVLKEINSL